MEINKILAVYPVNKVISYKKDGKSDEKNRNTSKDDRDFEKALQLKKREGAAVDEKV